MEIFSLGNITFVLCVVCLLLALYQLINIFFATPARASVVYYDEESHFNSSLGTHETNLMPVYRYMYQGFTKTYRSHFAIPFNWIKKDHNKIYIAKNGKVFEKEGVIAALLGAVIFFLIV